MVHVFSGAHTLLDTVSLAGWRGSWGDTCWTHLPLDAGCHCLECSYTLTNTSMYLEIKKKRNITNYAVYPSNANMTAIQNTVYYSTVCWALIHTLSCRTEFSRIGSEWVKPTASGLRIQPVNEIVDPGGCWDSQVGSE